MTTFNEVERHLLVSALTSPDGAVPHAVLLSGAGLSSEPAMLRLAAAGLFEFRERPLPRWVLTGDGVALANRRVAA